MTSKPELAVKYTRKFIPTVFDSGIGAKLPDAYKKFYNEWRNTPPEAVHYIPHTGSIWQRDSETGEIKRVENVPLPRRIPKELHNVFTGGEAVIQGFVKKKLYSNRVPRFWMPTVYRSVVYSEILDKYLSALITKRVIDLIYKHQGFDNYLLSTKACDLMTMVALKLKKVILLALYYKDLPYDNEKNNMIYQKYEKYLLPLEEIKWYGLSFTEACNKYKALEAEQRRAEIVPLKNIYRTQLIEELKNQTQDSEESEVASKGWFQKLPGISKLTKDN